MRRMLSKLSVASLLLISMFLVNGTGTQSTDGRAPLPPPYHEATVNVNLSYPNGTPVPNVDVFLTGSETDGPIEVGVTDANGMATMMADYRLWGHSYAYARDSPSYPYTNLAKEPFYAEPDSVVEVNLTFLGAVPKDNTVSGTVTNRSTGLQIEGIQVWLDYYDILDNQVEIDTLTDASGRYDFQFANTERPIRLQVEDSLYYRSKESQFMLEEGVDSYDMDLIVTWYGEMDADVSLRFYNSTTDGTMPGEQLELRGSSDRIDHEREYFGFSPNAEGWYNFTICSGEFEATWTYREPSKNLTISLISFLYVNSSGTELEIPIDTHSLAPLDVSVANATDPLKSAQVQWEQRYTPTEGRLAISGYSTTDAFGMAHIWVPSDGISIIRVNKPPYTYTSVPFDPSAGTPPYSLDVTLVMGPVIDVPKVPVTFIVRDSVTGVQVPKAQVNGGSPENDLFFFTFANDTGVLQFDISVGTYSYISAYSHIGKKQLSDIVFEEGGGPYEIYLDLERYPTFEEGLIEFWFNVVDEEGAPVSDLSVNIYRDSEYGYEQSYMPDVNGRVVFRAPPGDYYFFDEDLETSLQRYTYPSTRFTVPATDAQLPDLTVYSRYPAEEVHGHVLDKTTSVAIPNCDVDSYSLKLLGERPKTILDIMYRENLAILHGTEGSATFDGFYRLWGKDETIIIAHKEGYLPYSSWVEKGTRVTEHDILMEPAPTMDSWISGILVDEEDNPLAGYIAIMDRDRPDLIIPVNDTEMDETGLFNMTIYRGNFTLMFQNETLEDTLDVTVGPEGLSDLKLVLRPETTLEGTVVNWEDLPVEGINVTFMEFKGGLWEGIGWELTDADGHFELNVLAGTYRVSIARTELFDAYESGDLTTNGWTPIVLSIVMTNRTAGDMFGHIGGTGGPYASGIPGTTVFIEEVMDTPFREATTDENGDFNFTDLAFGHYYVSVSPPEPLTPILDQRSGYIGVHNIDVDMAGATFTLEDIILQFEEHGISGYVNITYHSPTGTGVYLDTPIVIEFSEPMNTTMTEDMFHCVPALKDPTFEWDDYDAVLTVEHGPFEVDTNYTVTISGAFMSWTNDPLWGYQSFSWSFVTGNTTDPWVLYDVNMTLDEDRTVTVDVVAAPDISIFIVILNVDYFELEDLGDGSYHISINGSNFDWNTTYSYFFTDVYNGLDKAPSFAGAFRTPEEPVVPVVWNLTSASVVVRQSGTWHVQAEGNAGLDVYIVIDGVGSFKLVETATGFYELDIPYENFDWEETYAYHFSDRPGGPDLAPSLAGSVDQCEEPEPIGEDNDDWVIYTGICCGILIVIVLILIVVAVVAIRSRKGSEDLEE